MNKKLNIMGRIIALLIVVTLSTVSICTENVAAFYNQDGSNEAEKKDRNAAKITVQLMQCKHKDTHYNSNGIHINDTTGDKIIRKFEREPSVINDTAAGTATYDINKYVYEYEMSYSEGAQVDYAVITTPNITHYESTASGGVRETHSRMYWLGEYNSTMENLTATEGANEWYSFAKQCGAAVNSDLSRQTWETVESGNSGSYKGEYVVSLDVSRTIDNGQKFLYLLEGTFFDRNTRDSNHPDMQSTGAPSYYGTHVYGVIGLVFYRNVKFDANGGTMAEETIRSMQVYNGSRKCKILPWYSNTSKERFYSGIDVSSPQVTTAYGTASVKSPTRTSYVFTGWYDSPDGGVMLYDTDGNAVKGTQYFDAEGNWIYKGNVTAYAGWEYVGNYVIRYSKGASDTYITPPSDTVTTVGTAAILADTQLTGSRYRLSYEGNTNNEHSRSTSLPATEGTFKFAGWNIGGTVCQPGTLYGETLVKDSVVTATAVYSGYTVRLPKLSSTNYELEGWYESYDGVTGTFAGYIGKPGDDYVINAAESSFTKTIYAKWTPADVALNFNYLIPDAAKNSSLGYTLTGADETSRTLTFGTGIGVLPEPELSGYTFVCWNWTADGAGGTASADGLYYGIDGNGDPADTLYAMWKPLGYIIKYDYNGAEDITSNPTEAEYYDILSIAAPTLAGAEFAGWEITGMDNSPHLLDGTKTNSESASGIGAGKSRAEFIGLNGSEGTVLFTAQWNYAKYNITYDFNGGSPVSGGSYPAEASVYEYFDISNPEKGPALFKGWTVKGMDEGTHCVGGAYVDGATASGAGAGKAAGAKLPFASLRYTPGTVTLVAAWEADDRQLIFMTDTGTMTGKSIQDNWTLRFIRFGSKNFISKNAYDVEWGTDVPSVKRTGYTFNGFYTELKGGTQVFNGGSSGSMADRMPTDKLTAGAYRADNGTWVGPSLILYAHFTPLEFELTFDVNGGVWADDKSSGTRTLGVTYDSDRNSTVWGSADVERTGYIPGGWNTRADGTGYTVFDTDGYSTDEGGYWSENYRKQVD